MAVLSCEGGDGEEEGGEDEDIQMGLEAGAALKAG